MTLVGTCGPTTRAAKQRYLSHQRRIRITLGLSAPIRQAFYSDMFGKSNLDVHNFSLRFTLPYFTPPKLQPSPMTIDLAPRRRIDERERYPQPRSKVNRSQAPS